LIPLPAQFRVNAWAARGKTLAAFLANKGMNVAVLEQSKEMDGELVTSKTL
jgi:hypothetical protein